MKKVQKLLAALMALCMAFAVQVPTFAAGDNPSKSQYSDDAFVTITKVYKLEGEGVSPFETFTLEQVGTGMVKDGEAKTAPDLGTITGAAFGEGAATKDGTKLPIVIDLPTYERVGIYEYTLREVSGNTAGVSYYGNDIKLVVTVINDEASGKLRVAAVHTESIGDEKKDSFPNTYSAGTLQITKEVTGNLGDKTRTFEFTVTLTGEEGKTYGKTYEITGGSYPDNPTALKIGEPATLYLKHGDTISIENLPYGVKYAVTENVPADYTVKMSENTGTIETDSVTASFINHKGGTPDTGVFLDSMPYIAVLALAAAGFLILFAKKRFWKKQ